MSTMTVLGIIITAIGALILAFPLWKPEDIRTGRLVKPRGKGKDNADQINRAIEHSGRAYFWTDRKIFLVGSASTMVGAVFLVVGVTS